MKLICLNNNGDRWVIYDDTGRKPKVTVEHDGKFYQRTALEFRQFGNFVSVIVSIGGKRINTLKYENVGDTE